MVEHIMTPEEFCEKLKNELQRGQVLYTTKGNGKPYGGKKATYSAWERSGRLRFHMEGNENDGGQMRYITETELMAVYSAYVPDDLKGLGRQIEKICGYRDVRKGVLKQLMQDYA